MKENRIRNSKIEKMNANSQNHERNWPKPQIPNPESPKKIPINSKFNKITEDYIYA